MSFYSLLHLPQWQRSWRAAVWCAMWRAGSWHWSTGDRAERGPTAQLCCQEGAGSWMEHEHSHSVHLNQEMEPDWVKNIWLKIVLLLLNIYGDSVNTHLFKWRFRVLQIHAFGMYPVNVKILKKNVILISYWITAKQKQSSGKLVKKCTCTNKWLGEEKGALRCRGFIRKGRSLT